LIDELQQAFREIPNKLEELDFDEILYSGEDLKPRLDNALPLNFCWRHCSV